MGCLKVPHSPYVCLKRQHTCPNELRSRRLYSQHGKQRSAIEPRGLCRDDLYPNASLRSNFKLSPARKCYENVLIQLSPLLCCREEVVGSSASSANPLKHHRTLAEVLLQPDIGRPFAVLIKTDTRYCLC